MGSLATCRKLDVEKNAEMQLFKGSMVCVECFYKGNSCKASLAAPYAPAMLLMPGMSVVAEKQCIRVQAKRTCSSTCALDEVSFESCKRSNCA